MRRLFVANAGEDSISVLCPGKMREIERIPIGGGAALGPRCIAVNAGRLIIANCFNSSILSLDLATGAQDYYPVGACPGSMCPAPDGWIVACTESDSLWKLDMELAPQFMATLGKFPLCVSSCGNHALVSHLGSRDAVLCDASTLAQKSRVALSGNPFGSLITDNWLLVSQAYGNKGFVGVYRYDGSHVGRIALPGVPGRLIEADGRVFAANYWERGLFALNMKSMALEGVWETSGMPDELALDSRNGRIFVSCMMDNVVDVLDLSGKRLGGISVGNEPRGLAME